MKPFGLLSDQHFHEWSAFAVVGPDGVNSRLSFQLAELRRAANVLRSAGGNRIVIAGDTFHIRGGVRASVLNPVLDAFQILLNEGFEILMIPGNHDVASRDAERLSSSVTALESIGCKVFNKPTAFGNLVFVPWFANVDDLKKVLEGFAGVSKADLIIHAPIDEVIPGLPAHGLSGEYLSELGFNRVFAGHYHDHKEVVPGQVWSIGATTHQTWSDVGTKAGFLIVGDGVEFNATHAPQFIDISETIDVDELPLIVDGNFVRVRVTTSKPAEIEAVRQLMLDHGALGALVIATPKEEASTVRSNVQVAKSASLDESVAEYIESCGYDNAVGMACAAILNQVRSI